LVQAYIVRAKVQLYDKGKIMTYTTSAAFAKKIASIKTSTVALRADIQSALIDATYLCLAHSGGTSPFQNILDAVGNAAHRQGITQWAETFAPVQLIKDKILLNKTAWNALNLDDYRVNVILPEFEAYIESTGMNEASNLWYVIAKEKNTTTSVFDLDKSFDAFMKKLEKNDLSGLAEALRNAEQNYYKQAIGSELRELVGEEAGE
jgi:hypothetical protein